MVSLYLRALRAAWTEFRRTLALDGYEHPDEVYVWPKQVQGIGDIENATGLELVNPGPWISAPASALWKVTLHREPIGDGKYRYLSGVATCTNDDRVRDVLRLEAVE